MKIQHDFFGTLDFSEIDGTDVIWEKDIDFDGQTIDVELWANDESQLSQEKLNKFAQFIHQLSNFDKICRKKLMAYLDQDSSYIEEHYAEIPDLEIFNTLGDNPTSSNFVNVMKLDSVSLWQQETDRIDEQIVFDYMIDPKNSDQILAVKFDIDGNFQNIAWES